MLDTRQRPEAFAWSPPGIQFKGAIVAEYAHYFDPHATNRKSRLEFVTIDDIFSEAPQSSVNKRSSTCEYRFNELSWAPLMSTLHPLGVIFGGTENGTVVFIDAHKFIHGGTLSIISSRRDHNGHVLSVDYSIDNRWAISAGGAAQLLLWDLTNLSTPFSPGNPNFTDQVKRVRWNRSADNIVVSLSSHRSSLWDMRRPGGPVLEFAESGSGCDWADICWKPDDSTTLIISSQLALTPGIQKWDLRYPTAPVNEFHMHDRGVNAIDWHRRDPRIVVSAGNDGYVRVFSPETGELHGTVQLQQNDKVRAITWSEVHPDLLAIQFFQNPTEFRSIEGRHENAILRRLPVTIVPAWVSAAPVGASFALGGRMAAHYRHWDHTRQMWHYCVEIKKLPIDNKVRESAMELQNACDSNALGGYCEDRAHEKSDRNLQILWTLLAAVSNGQGRREYVRIFGFGGDESISKESGVSRISTTSNEVTQLTNIMSSMNYSSPKQNSHGGPSVSDDDDSANDCVFIRQPDLDFNELGESTWLLFDALINEGDQVVIDSLLAQKDYATAFMLARRDNGLLRRVTEKYITEKLSAPQRLFSLISTASFDQLIETFPRHEWARLLVLVLTRTDHIDMVHYMRKLAVKWNADKGPNTLHAAFAAILAQDMKLFLRANDSCPLDERMKQAIVLQAATGIDVNEEYEMLLYKYCEKLINSGVSELAWRLLSNFNTKSELLLSLRHDLFFICGCGDRTMSKESMNLLSTSQSSACHQSTLLPPAGYIQPPSSTKSPIPSLASSIPSNISGAYYSGMLNNYNASSIVATTGLPQNAYQQSLNSTMNSNLRTIPGFKPVPSPITPPAVVGVPPVMPTSNYAAIQPASYATLHASGVIQNRPRSVTNSPISSISSSAMQSNNVQATTGWNDPPPLPGRISTSSTKQVLEVPWQPLEPPSIGIINGAMEFHSNVSQRISSTQSSSDQKHEELNLSQEDKAIIQRFYQLIDAIVAASHAPVTVHKVEEAKTRIDCELAPRLAAGKLSPATRHLLLQCCELSSRGDYRGAGVTCRLMVQAGGDFVEVSSFMPALKSLFSLAQSTFSISPQ